MASLRKIYADYKGVLQLEPGETLRYIFIRETFRRKKRRSIVTGLTARFLITGAKGCIGSWVVKNLVESGQCPVIFDLDTKSHRLAMLLDEEQMKNVSFVQGDISELHHLERAVVDHGITNVIHLAGLQVPFCAADPPRGVRVNVLGTINVFEVAKRRRDQIKNVVYASSCAVFGPPDFYGGKQITGNAPLYPLTHYGAFKQCNEVNALVYYNHDGISSVGLRPWAVYGAGRDQGRSSGPTKAIKAAVVGQNYTIPFTGGIDLHYADDVAKIFIRSSETSLTGARVYSPRGSVVQISEFMDTLKRVLPQADGLISASGGSQQVAYDIDDSDLARDLGPIPSTSLEKGIAETACIFETLHHDSRLDTADLMA
jgi:nucleoside-diphosphate-sugar epimerase